MGSSAYNLPIIGDSGEFDSLAKPFHTSLKQDPDGGWGTGLSLHPLEKGERSPSLGHDAEDAIVDDKRFTESLHARKDDGRFILSSGKTKNSRRKT
jgi:hypothetical protein